MEVHLHLILPRQQEAEKVQCIQQQAKTADQAAEQEVGLCKELLETVIHQQYLHHKEITVETMLHKETAVAEEQVQVEEMQAEIQVVAEAMEH
jgi:hypothetical protein